MTFIERAIERSELAAAWTARLAFDFDRTRAELAAHPNADILILGAMADALRARECGNVVRIHPSASPNVRWIDRTGKSELELVREIALARITMEPGLPLGVDWATQGLEIQQVALGFGITDLTGPMTRKAGDLIDADALKKVKGKGMVAATALRRLEIAALIKNAGRECVFTDDVPARAAHVEEVANA